MAQSQLLLDLFRMQWDEAPTVWLDTETTGTRVGFDRCVQVAVVRFDRGEPGESFSALINPGMPIPPEVTEIHGITDAMVKDAMSLGDFFAHPQTIKLLDGAQPGAYNGPFDKHFVPPFGPDWTWPWLDGLTLVRKEDRYAKGAGRHKLAAACERHGVELPKAHDAVSDARSAGRLFYRMGRKMFPKIYTLGGVLGWQRKTEAAEWERFYWWLSTQPPREAQADG
jgi:DNA polymerase III epsilon subunit-like protein